MKRGKRGRVASGQMDGCMDGKKCWSSRRSQPLLLLLLLGVSLGGEGIKALHINTIMKGKKKKVKQ